MTSYEIEYLYQYDEAVRIATADGCQLTYSVGLAIYQRNTRLFLQGDLVLVWFSNGVGQRWHVYGRSSRGYEVSNHYEQGHRYRDRGIWQPQGMNGPYSYGPYRICSSDCYSNKSTIRLIDVPGEISSSLKSDPALLRRWFLEALRIGYAARGVGSGSPAFSLPPLPYVADARPPRARRKQRNYDGGKY
jgi:hypothetical protein